MVCPGPRFALTSAAAKREAARSSSRKVMRRPSATTEMRSGQRAAARVKSSATGRAVGAPLMRAVRSCGRDAREQVHQLAPLGGGEVARDLGLVALKPRLERPQ